MDPSNPSDPTLREGTDSATRPTMPPGVPVTDSAARFGKFVRTTKLGAGGMGEVWKAWDTELSRWVALKFLKGADEEEIIRFKREAQTAARLSHPNIAAVYEVGAANGRHYIAMQFVAGTTLAALPRRDVGRLVRLVRDAARALETAHVQGIVHRDLKPANLMIEGDRVYVMDFGLAKQTTAGAGLSVSGMAIGTPAYMPPEQARGEVRAVDARSDVYALGATLYDLIAGSPPFAGEQAIDVLMRVVSEEPVPLRRLRPDVDSDIETIVMKCIEKEPGRRYDSARALAADLDRWVEGEPIAARRASYAYRFGKTLRKRRAVLGALAFGLIAAVVGLVGLQAREISKSRAMERARVHLERARRSVEQLRLRVRRPYDRAELRTLARGVEADADLALAEAPGLPEALLAKSTACELSWDRDRALEFVQQAIRASPDFATAYLDRVRLRLRLYEHARRSRQTAELMPLTDEARALRASLEADLARVAVGSRDSTELLFGKALMAYADLSPAEAESHLAKYLDVVPEDGRAHYYRGRALHDARRTRESEKEATRAIECDWGDPDARQLRAAIRSDRRDYAGAVEDLDVGIGVEPARSAIWASRAAAKCLLKDLPGAQADIDEALRRDPAMLDRHLLRASLLRAKGDGDGAMAEYARAIEADPKSSRPLISRGVMKFEQRDFRGALEDFERAVAIEPTPIAHLDRGNARRELGDLDGAEADFSRAIELHAEYATAYDRRSSLRLKRGDLPGAEADISRLIELTPDSVRAFVLRGTVRARQKNLEGAFGDFSKCLELNPREADARVNRANIYWERGEHATAIAEARRALDDAPPTWPRRADIERVVAAWEKQKK